MENQRTRKNTPSQYDQCRNQCYRCGFPWSDRHFCPAFRQECFRCGVFGHFGRMCFSRSVDILYRRTKPKKQRARDQRRMEEFLQRKSVMMFLPFADIENEHLGACLYTKAPKEVSKVNMVHVQTPVSSAKAQTQTSASTSDSSSQTEPDSTTISTLQQLWKSVNYLRDEATVLHVSCDQIVKEGQQDFSLFKEQTQKLADIAIRQKAENDQLKQQLEQSLGQITTLTTTLATKQQEIDDLKKAMEDSVQSPVVKPPFKQTPSQNLLIPSSWTVSLTVQYYVTFHFWMTIFQSIIHQIMSCPSIFPSDLKFLQEISTSDIF